MSEHQENRKREREAAFVLVLVAIGFVALAWGPHLMQGAQASTSNVTVTWLIPTDKSMTLTYPANSTEIFFHPTTSTFAELYAHGQGNGSTAAITVTNAGNVAINVAATFTTALATGLGEFRIANASAAGLPSGSQRYWCGGTSDTGQSPAGGCSGVDNHTVSWTIYTALSAASAFSKWAWSWGTAVAASYSHATWQLTSS